MTALAVRRRRSARNAERVDVASALRDAGFTGLIAFGLFLPLIGFQTVSQRQQ